MLIKLLTCLFFLLPLVWGLALETSITSSCLKAYLKEDEDDPITTVANGELAKLKEFPHLASIGWKNEDKIHWGCGGSLITPKFILTAAHCAYRFQRGKRVPPNVARMGAVELDLDNLGPFDFIETEIKDKEETAQQFEIVRVLPHPEYTSKKRYNDIALMELEKEVKLTDFVVPICLWNKKSEVFTDLLAAGFGEVEFASGTSPTLNKVTLTRTSIGECRTFYEAKGDKKLPDGLVEEQHVCASDKTDREMDTCQGDSGGPLEFRMLSKLPDTQHWVKIPVLLGLTSFGQAGCGTNAPAVYTRVSSYIEWIEAETKESLDPTKCASRYERFREKLDDAFPAHDSPSKVQVGDCIGVIIHEDFVLTSKDCVTATPSSIRTSDNQTVLVEKTHQNEKFGLLQLKSSIKFTARTLEELKDEAVNEYPYLYRVGPTCIKPEEVSESEGRPYRDIEASFNNHTFKFEQRGYNISECSLYLDVEETLDETHYECLGGKWFVPEACSIQPSSFTSQNYFEDSEVYYEPIPLVKSFVREHSSCGAILAAKITGDDVKWIDSIIFKQ